VTGVTCDCEQEWLSRLAQSSHGIYSRTRLSRARSPLRGSLCGLSVAAGSGGYEFRTIRLLGITASGGFIGTIGPQHSVIPLDPSRKTLRVGLAIPELPPRAHFLPP
jgi:hypothetical protein